MFKFWNRNDNARRDASPRVIRQQIITPIDLSREPNERAEALRSEVLRAIESQHTSGRYRVRVRRKNVHL